MPAEAACPECDASFPLTPAVKGKKVRCKQCGHVFVAGASRGRDRDDDRVTARRPPERRSARRGDDDEDDRPRRSGAGLGGGALAALIGGGVALLVAVVLVAGVALGWFSPGKAPDNANPGPLVQGPGPNPGQPPNPGPVVLPNKDGNPGPRPNPNPIPPENPPARPAAKPLQPTTTRIQLDCTDVELKSAHFAATAKVAGVYHKHLLENRHRLDLYDWGTGNLIAKVPLKEAQPGRDHTLALSPDGKRLLQWDPTTIGAKNVVTVLALPGGDKAVATWDPAATAPPAVPLIDRSLVMVEFLDDNTVAAMTPKGWYAVWTLDPLQQTAGAQVLQPNRSVRRAINTTGQGGGDFALSPDRSRLAVFNGEGYNVVDARTGQVLRMTARTDDPRSLLHRRAVVFSPDGGKLVGVVTPEGPVAADPDAKDLIHLWDVKADGKETPAPTTFAVRHDAKLQGSTSSNSGGNLDGSFRIDAASFWGEKALVLLDPSCRHGHVIDLERKEYVQSLFTNFASGRQLVGAPDGRLWFVNAPTRETRSCLAAVDPPVAAVTTPTPKNPGGHVGWFFLSPDGIEVEFRPG